MNGLRRLVSEPLIQFLVIGAFVFGAWSLVGRSPREADRQTIEVGPGRIAQLSVIFSRTWQRPPTPEELNGLIEAFVKEEILYREGTRMGLDQDDTIFRRRMQQKMEFLMESAEAEPDATEEELQAYLTANAAVFHVPAHVAFRQIYLDAAKRGDAAMEDAAALLADIQSDASGGIPQDAGDPTLLPQTVPLMRIDQIGSNFGRRFAAALASAEVGRWTGPHVSSFGLPLVFVEERTPARDPGLDAIRDLVLREWRSERRRAIAEERYQALRTNYDVTVTLPPAQTTSVTSKNSIGK
jgi:hypothetical protein